MSRCLKAAVDYHFEFAHRLLGRDLSTLYILVRSSPIRGSSTVQR